MGFKEEVAFLKKLRKKFCSASRGVETVPGSKSFLRSFFFKKATAYFPSSLLRLPAQPPPGVLQQRLRLHPRPVDLADRAGDFARVQMLMRVDKCVRDPVYNPEIPHGPLAIAVGIEE